MNVVRVLVAEDSATVRALLVAMLESDPGIVVVGEAADGMEAVEMADRLRPDLVTMDVHMPRMDGLEATREIMIRAPTPIVIVSSLAGDDVELALGATHAGALTVLPTPDAPLSERFEERRERLIATVKAMAAVKVVRRWRAAPAPLPARLERSEQPARVVAIAASTGGPAALQRILCDLPPAFALPVLVTQHMAPGFARGLCSWLSRTCGREVTLAAGGEPLRPGSVHLAPDDRHLGVAHHRIRLSDADPVGGFRPSATALFASVARAYGAGAVGVILTGMGDDGVEGLRAVRAAGGRVIAQDEDSSVVYGMPKEALRAGVVDRVLPLDAVAPALRTLAQEHRDRT